MSAPGTTTARRGGIPLGRPLGIPIYLAPSWLVIGVLVAVGVADRASLDLPELSAGGHYGVGIAVAALLAASVLAHELGHSVVSVTLGLPIKRITLFLLGGLAEIEREPETPAREYLVAMAGPLTSILIAGVSAALAVTVPWEAAEFVLAYVAETNTVLAVFNLIPGLPLDGGRVLRAAVWHVSGDAFRATRWAVRAGQALALALGALGVIGILGGDAYGLFTLLIAFFIWSSGTQGLRRAEVGRRIPTLAARQLAVPTISVPADLPLAEAMRRAQEAARGLLVVDSYGRPSAIPSVAAASAVPNDRRPWVTIGSVSRPIGPGLVISAELTGAEFLAALRSAPASEYLVIEEAGDVLGVLAARDVARQIDARGAAAVGL